MRTVLTTAITLGLMGVLAGCANKTEGVRPGTAAKVPITVQVVEPKPSVAVGDLLVPASLSVEGIAIVLAQRDGTVSQLGAQEGSRVTKGQVIARLSGDDDLQAQLRQAELEVSRLEVEQRQYGALIKVNRNELERETLLFKQGLTADRDVERAQFKLDAAVLELEKTRVAGQSAQAKVVGLKAELERSTIRAPITGVVTRRFTKLGTNVVKNDKLFEVTKLAPLEVKFQVPQTEKAGLRPGSVVSISSVESDKIIARAVIRRVDLVADAASNTLGFLADLSGGPGLMPGMAVNVHIPRRGASPTLWIPQSAFPAGASVHKGATSTVFVAIGDKCVARAVWIDSVTADQVEIISGLAMGDRVILSPPAELRAGDSVVVKN